jgi:hypothetical protein
MKELTQHIVEGDSANHQLKIQVMDEPGAGGACHRYEVTGFNTETNKSKEGAASNGVVILFQNGPIKEVGVNGVTHEALLTIVIDRLVAFQEGPFYCSENQLALQHAAHCLNALQLRTKARIARGVEGTHEK